MTIKEAAYKWVNEFNAIPQSVVEKLAKLDIDDIQEITPPSMSDHVSIYSGEYAGEYGEIVDTSKSEDNIYMIIVDGKDAKVELNMEDFEVEHDDFLPMWGTMWTFGDGIDNNWIEDHVGLQAMADCGFRIYEQEDFQYIFGIDGAGYDFYEQHWIPLYKARGLQWHDENVL